MNLTAENTAIVLDSTADFPEAPERFANWRVVPLYVRFGADSYRDYVDMSPEEFYSRLRTSDELPTTSQPTPADFLSAYEDLGGYERVFSLHVSAKLSGTFASAEQAAAESGGRVRVIDTATASAAITMLGLAIQRRLEAGTTDEDVDELVDRFKHDTGLIFTLDTLEYLARGGRIGRASSWAGQLLHIKPILTLADGEVLPLKRVRGNQKAIKEFATAFGEGTARRAGAPRRHRARRRAGADGRAGEAREGCAPEGRDRGRDHPRPSRRHPRRPRDRRPVLATGLKPACGADHERGAGSARAPVSRAQLVRLFGQLVVALGDGVLDVRPPAQGHAIPVDLDVGMVILALGEFADPVHERERLGEVAKLVLSLQSSFNKRVTSRRLHRD